MKTFAVIGCGPSISKVDFSLLKGITTIGVNHIADIFDPDYLIWRDQQVKTESLVKSNAKKFCLKRGCKQGVTAQIFSLYDFQPLSILPKHTFIDKPVFSDNAAELAGGKSSIFAALNLAVVLGAEKIILLGVDLHNRDHFYNTDERPFPNYEKMLEDFGRVAEYAIQKRILILNANPESKLQCFRRTTLIKALEG